MTNDDAFAKGQQMLDEGRDGIALEYFSAAAEESGDEEQRLAAIAHAVTLNIALGRPHEALVWVDRLRLEAPNTDQADLLAARAQLGLGNGEAALALLDRVRQPDTAHFTYAPSFISLLRSEALAQAGRIPEAVALTLDAIQQDPAVPEAWQLLARLISDDEGLDVDLSRAIDLMPDAALGSATAGLVNAPVAGAERLIHALWRRWPEDRRLLALLATLGYRLPVPSALEWSARMRAAGQGEHCPLLGVAASTERHPRERVRAAAAAQTTFSDDRARSLLELATTAVADEDIAETFEEVLSLSPDLAASFVVAAAQTARRALITAQILDAKGSLEPALALARHALELTTGQPELWNAAVSVAFAEVEEFATRAEQAGEIGVAAALREAG